MRRENPAENAMSSGHLNSSGSSLSLMTVENSIDVREIGRDGHSDPQAQIVEDGEAN